MPAEGPPSRGSSGGALNRTQGSPSVMQEPDQPPVDPEVLALGTSAPDRTLRNALIVLVAALAVVAAGLVAWRIMPHPDPPITLDDLEGVYAGMVRSDGVNDASVLHRQSPSRNDASVDPAACLPLFDTTAFNQFPVEALDGVGTYWLVEPSAISLFTFRFADAQAADRAYRRVTAALSGCAGRQVRVSEPSAATGDLSRIEVTRAGGARPQVGYLFTTGPRTRFAILVMRYDNTVTWQYRYESGALRYSTLPAQQLTDALVVQMRSVLALRTR